MVHFEFMGAPGAGKSTLRREVLAALRRRDTPCLTVEEALARALKTGRDDILWRLLLKFIPRRLIRRPNSILSRSRSRGLALSRFLANTPSLPAAVAASEVFARMKPDEKALALLRITDTAATYQLVSEWAEEDERVVFDEGFAQRTMSVFLSPGAESSPDRTAAARYMEAAPRPDVAVLVEAETSTCMERLRSRPKGLPRRLAGMDQPAFETFLAGCREHFRRVAQMMEESGVRMLRVSNDASPGEVVTGLADAMVEAIGAFPAWS